MPSQPNLTFDEVLSQSVNLLINIFFGFILGKYTAGHEIRQNATNEIKPNRMTDALVALADIGVQALLYSPNHTVSGGVSAGAGATACLIARDIEYKKHARSLRERTAATTNTNGVVSPAGETTPLVVTVQRHESLHP